MSRCLVLLCSCVFVCVVRLMESSWVHSTKQEVVGDVQEPPTQAGPLPPREAAVENSYRIILLFYFICPALLVLHDL